MYIIPDSIIYDPRLLSNYIHRHHITRILFTPSLLEAVLDTPGLDFAELFKSIRYVYIVENHTAHTHTHIHACTYTHTHTN